MLSTIQRNKVPAVMVMNLEKLRLRDMDQRRSSDKKRAPHSYEIYRIGKFVEARGWSGRRGAITYWEWSFLLKVMNTH